MIKHFKTLQLAVSLYRECEKLKVPLHLKDQLLRASSSICLNLSEGRGKRTTKDQVRFFSIAMGSLRETITIIILANHTKHISYNLADRTAASLYMLIKNAR